MILDRGECAIYRQRSVTPPGGKPRSEEEMIFSSYYGELSFETSPSRPTEMRPATRTASRIRILQERSIQEGDKAELTPFDGSEAKTQKYRVTRAWHGTDEENGEPITDLTLEVDER